jgi:hypothetical protein
MHVCKKLWCLAYIWLAMVTAAVAQQRTEGRAVYERLVAVVPIVGAGSYDDPRRPAYVPEHLLPGRGPVAAVAAFATARAKGEAPRAIVGFHYELSDDSQFALVEFEATHTAAFESLRQAARTPFASREVGANRNALDGGFDLKVFDVGRVRANVIEAALRASIASTSRWKALQGGASDRTASLPTVPPDWRKA